jgi:hypothetical protein
MEMMVSDECLVRSTECWGLCAEGWVRRMECCVLCSESWVQGVVFWWRSVECWVLSVDCGVLSAESWLLGAECWVLSGVWSVDSWWIDCGVRSVEFLSAGCLVLIAELDCGVLCWVLRADGWVPSTERCVQSLECGVRGNVSGLLCSDGWVRSVECLFWSVDCWDLTVRCWVWSVDCRFVECELLVAGS